MNSDLIVENLSKESVLAQQLQDGIKSCDTENTKITQSLFKMYNSHVWVMNRRRKTITAEETCRLRKL